MNKYTKKNYITKDRWNNFFYQIKGVRFFEGAESVLEIGVGNKIVSDTLKKLGFDVKTLDIDRELEPDIISSADNMPVEDKSFDVVVACEILEHLPFEKFEKCLSEIKRAAKMGAVISLPHAGYTFSLSFKIPLIKWKRVICKIPHFWRSKTSTSEHYWEPGLKGYPVSKIKNTIKKAGFEIQRSFIGPDDPSHIFFILKILE